MAEMLAYARPGLKRRRRVPPDVLIGMAVGSVTLLYNIGLASGLLAEMQSPIETSLAHSVAVFDAAIGAVLGAVLIAGVVALTLRSSRALMLHQIYAWGKIAVAPVALATYGLLLSEHGWGSPEVRVTMCIIVVLGAVYPVFILLGLRRVRAEDSTAELG